MNDDLGSQGDHPQRWWRLTDDHVFAYTLGIGRLYMDFDRFQHLAEALMGRPILTHEFADHDLWLQMREVYEEKLLTRPTE